jgi:hypothetical protein
MIAHILEAAVVASFCYAVLVWAVILSMAF